MKEDYRGRCYSKNKVTKAGYPKMAGNFSYQTFHHQQLQSKDYYVKLHVYESGVKTLIVGDHTPLAEIMGYDTERLAINDEHFDAYVRRGVKTIGGKEHEAYMRLTKVNTRKSWMLDPHAFVYREEIYTDGDFNYPFPNY